MLFNCINARGESKGRDEVGVKENHKDMCPGELWVFTAVVITKRLILAIVDIFGGSSLNFGKKEAA